MDLKQANITDQNNVNGIGRASNGVAGDFLNENGIVYEELDLTEKSDDNDSVDENSGVIYLKHFVAFFILIIYGFKMLVLRVI